MTMSRTRMLLVSVPLSLSFACTESETPPPKTAAEGPTAAKYTPPIMPAYEGATSAQSAQASGPPELKGGPGSRPATATTDPPRERVGSARVSAPSISGQLANAETVTSGLRAAFARCYDNALESEPNAEGTIWLAVSVAKDGTVSRVDSTPQGKVPASVDDCIKMRAKSAQFGAPVGGTAIVSFGVTLEKTAASEGSTAPASDAVTVSPSGAFSESDKVAGFVRAQARNCYRLALRIDPSADGRMTVNVTIDDKGGVTAVQATSSGKLPDTLAACVERNSRKAQFAKPSSAPVTVTIPIALSLKPKK